MDPTFWMKLYNSRVANCESSIDCAEEKISELRLKKYFSIKSRSLFLSLAKILMYAFLVKANQIAIAITQVNKHYQTVSTPGALKSSSYLSLSLGKEIAIQPATTEDNLV